MPAGNDAEAHEAFRSSVESQYGPYQNAEELVRAHQGMSDPGLRRAGLSRVDEEATAELTKGGLSKVASKFKDAPEDGELESVAVRGNALIGVFVLPSGDLVKRVTGANDKYDAKLSPADKEAKLRAEHDAQVARETAQLRADAEARVAAARAEIEADMTAEIEEIREKAQKEVDEASEAAKKDEGGGKGKSTKKDS